MTILNCSVDWLLTNPPTCPGLLSNTVPSLPFDVSQLDPVAVVSAVASGFFVVLPAYVIAWGATLILNFLRTS